VFVCTWAVGQREFWWDALERLLLWPNTLPSALRILGPDGSPVEADLAEWAVYTPDAAEQHVRWLAWEPPPTPRHALFWELWDRLHRCEVGPRARVLESLQTWAGGVGSVPRYRPLDREELKRLAKSPSIEVGAHTVSHTALSCLSSARQREEIVSSSSWLEGLTGRRPLAFSYPFGRSSDYGPETTRIVRESGFIQACANVHGTVSSGADPYQLPRVHVQDWTGEELLAKLSSWSDPR
jgi:peptidoglycan/xylan/chitin deacetylase (PgdA/CDA1 family)